MSLLSNLAIELKANEALASVTEAYVRRMGDRDYEGALSAAGTILALTASLVLLKNAATTPSPDEIVAKINEVITAEVATLRQVEAETRG